MLLLSGERTSIRVLLSFSRGRMADQTQEGGPSGIVGIGPDGKIVFADAAAAGLTGYSAASLIGQPIDRILRGWDVPAPSGSLILRSDGSSLPVDSTLHPIFDQTGAAGVIVMFKEKTALKEASEELKKTLSFLSATLEATTDGILGVDKEGRITSFNQKFAKMWRVPPEIVEARDDDKALAYALGQLKDPEGFLKKVRELYSQPDAESYDLLALKDGRVFERYSRPQRISGENVGRVWSFRDITERKQAEEHLEESRERIRLLLDSAAEAIYGLDLQGRCTFCNPSCLRLFGYTSPEEMIGKDLHPLIHHTRPDGTPYPLEACPIYQTSRSGQGAHVADDLFWRADGTAFPAEYWSYPVRKNGELVGSVVTFFDITERKQAREALENEMKTLESFVYTVTHDLKAPVVSIHGMASILKEEHGGEFTAGAGHYIDRILFNAAFMENLIHDLLELSRIGRKQTAENRIDAEAAIREILRRHSASLQERKIEVVLRSPLPRFTLEATQLTQLFQNLITNAAKFMGDQPRPRIEIGGTAVEKGVEFFVKDNGIGIDPAYHEKIFDLFHRLHEVEVEGTGIGMTIVKKVVTLNRGKLRLQSRKGEGTTFFIWFPQTDPPGKSSPPA